MTDMYWLVHGPYLLRRSQRRINELEADTTRSDRWAKQLREAYAVQAYRLKMVKEARNARNVSSMQSANHEQSQVSTGERK